MNLVSKLCVEVVRRRARNANVSQDDKIIPFLSVRPSVYPKAQPLPLVTTFIAVLVRCLRRKKDTLVLFVSTTQNIKIGKIRNISFSFRDENEETTTDTRGCSAQAYQFPTLFFSLSVASVHLYNVYLIPCTLFWSELTGFLPCVCVCVLVCREYLGHFPRTKIKTGTLMWTS